MNQNFNEEVFKDLLKNLVYPFQVQNSLSAEKFLNLAQEVAKDMVLSENIFPQVELGWYAFAGRKFSPDPEAYPNRQGRVAWINPDKTAPLGKRGLILLRGKCIGSWSSQECLVGANDKEDGQANTRKILAYGKEHNIKFSAAEWCASYCRNGIIPGEAFYPAINQLEKMKDFLEGWILSSSEFDAANVFGVFGGEIDYYKKSNNCAYVRAVAAF